MSGGESQSLKVAKSQRECSRTLCDFETLRLCDYLRAMKRLVVLALLVCACKSEAPAIDTVAIDTREPLRVSYVGAPELAIREQADDAAAVIATYGNGEAVSVLAERGEWVEVRTGDRTGWAKQADLTTAEAK